MGRARGRKSPNWGAWKSASRGPGGRSRPEAKAKCEISVQFLTFFCRKFRIWWVGAEIGQYFCANAISKIQQGVWLIGASIPNSHDATPSPFPLILPSLLFFPFLTRGRGYLPWENFGIKDACRWVLEHFVPPPNFHIFVPRGFPRRMLFASPVWCFWAPLGLDPLTPSPSRYSSGRTLVLDGESRCRSKAAADIWMWLTPAAESRVDSRAPSASGRWRATTNSHCRRMTPGARRLRMRNFPAGPRPCCPKTSAVWTDSTQCCSRKSVRVTSTQTRHFRMELL